MVEKSSFNVIAIIPARAHFDKIDHLNMKELGDNPLIYYAIKEAKKSKLIEKVFVSTEDEKIADFSKKNGARVSYIRAKKLTKKNILTDEVVKDFLKKSKIKARIIVTLLPNAPFMRAETIDKIIELLKKTKSDRIYSVKKIKSSIWKAEDKKKFLKITSGYKSDKNPFLEVAGGIFVSNIDYYFKSKKKQILCYISNEIESLMIQSIFDLIVADRLIDIDQTILLEMVKSR
tara:strand:+ start:1033 stop:1728 length:696 start_codon:yes stop_codon:yes gene_type:complete